MPTALRGHYTNGRERLWRAAPFISRPLRYRRFLFDESLLNKQRIPSVSSLRSHCAPYWSSDNDQCLGAIQNNVRRPERKTLKDHGAGQLLRWRRLTIDHNLLFRESENGLLSPSLLPAQGERPPVVLPIVSPTVFLPFDMAKRSSSPVPGTKLDVSETDLKNVFALLVTVECSTIIFETADTPKSVFIKLFSEWAKVVPDIDLTSKFNCKGRNSTSQKKTIWLREHGRYWSKIHFNLNFYKNILDRK